VRQSLSVRYNRTRKRGEAYLKESVHDIGNVVLPAAVLEADGIDKGAEETEGVKDTGLECYAASSDLIRQQLAPIRIQGSPAEVIETVAEEDCDKDSDSIVIGSVCGVH